MRPEQPSDPLTPLWSLMSRISKVVVYLMVLVLTAYRKWISPALRPRCRFVPSCSSYAVQSLQQRGLARGLAKILWRLARCHPLCKGGYDPP